MAKGYRPVDRDQVFLLPPDMRQWLPPGHRVWLVLDVVRALDTSVFHARARTGGVGRAGYDPDMLLGVLIYAYLCGVLSCRGVERACHTDVAFRIACAQDMPDHSTLSRFRREHQEAFTDLFEQVLMMCAAAGMGDFATVAIDGTKIAANASTGKNRQRSWLRQHAEDLVAAAEAADAAEDAAETAGAGRGDPPDPRWTDPKSRLAKIQEVLEQIQSA